MARVNNSSHLDPTSLNVVDVSSIARQTKGTPNDAMAQFNHLPPGMKIEDQPLAKDVKRTASMEPRGPLLSSAEKYGK